MKKDVFISIKGFHNSDGEVDSVELLTCGRFYRQKDRYYLSYDESETTGYEGCRTTLCVDKNRVTVRRSGAANAHLVVENNIRHQCSYDTGFGPIMVGVSGGGVRSTLSDQGGELEFSYSMDINTVLSSENRVVVHIKECGI